VKNEVVTEKSLTGGRANPFEDVNIAKITTKRGGRLSPYVMPNWERAGDDPVESHPSTERKEGSTTNRPGQKKDSGPERGGKESDRNSTSGGMSRGVV